MSFDAIEKYSTRLLIPKETGMFRCSTFKWTPRGDTKEHVRRESPLTNCVLFPKYVFNSVHVVPFLACMAGVQNFKNVLLINQKIYVHGWVFVCYQYLGIIIVL